MNSIIVFFPLILLALPLWIQAGDQPPATPANEDRRDMGWNPLLPPNVCVPDVEAHESPDGSLYLYGSWDLKRHSSYCSQYYHVFSSNDLRHWTDHGVSFDGRGVTFSKKESKLYAPDCLYKNGWYNLFFCMSDKTEGIARSRSPWGPFTDAKPVVGADKKQIDPAVFMDDDGTTYFFWGQYSLMGAKLTADLEAIDPSTLTQGIITNKVHGFHEGSSIRKRNGIYYLSYTDESRHQRASCIGYATSRSPLGPYTKGGIVIDNFGCDPATWNNHGSISQYRGKWYIFYHRSSQGTKFSRRVCAEPIAFGEDGSIAEVEMTTQGLGDPIPSRMRLAAYRACALTGSVCSKAIPDNAEMDELANIGENDSAGYRYLSFDGTERFFDLHVGTPSDAGSVEVCLDSPGGPVIATCQLESGKPNPRAALRTPVTGKHAVFLVFRGVAQKGLTIRSFQFN